MPNQQVQHIPRVKEGRKVSFDTRAARASHEIHACSVRLLLAARPLENSTSAIETRFFRCARVRDSSSCHRSPV